MKKKTTITIFFLIYELVVVLGFFPERLVVVVAVVGAVGVTVVKANR